MQLFGSIAVALAIVAVTIALVTAKLGPNAESDDDGVQLAEPVSRLFERGVDQRHQLFGVGEGVVDAGFRQERIARASPAAAC